MRNVMLILSVAVSTAAAVHTYHLQTDVIPAEIAMQKSLVEAQALAGFSAL